MRQQKNQKPMDEREKLRKFRELDDAFANALKELEGARPASSRPEPSEPEPSEEERQHERQRMFEARLKTLMKEYSQPAESVSTLLRTLVELGRIA